jgi:multidrug efflux pump subunit AcrB
MTALATILGLLPLAFGFGEGNETMVPLARAVVGGLLVSTMMTLLVVPILHSVVLARERPEPHITTRSATSEEI